MSKKSRLKAWFRRIGRELRVGSKTTVNLSSNETVSTPVNDVQGSATAPGSPIPTRIDAQLHSVLRERGYGTRLLRERGRPTLRYLDDTDLNWTMGHACYFGHGDVVSELLAQGVSPSEPSKFTNERLRGESKPLHIAVHGKRPNIIKLLAANGADLNTRDDVGRTPLHYADGKDTVELLLECGAEIDARDDFDETPLHAAARDGRGAAIEALLANGADLNDRSASGRTPMWVVSLKDPQNLDRLIRGGADINARDSEGRTLLHAAARKGTSDFVLSLLDRGADIESRDLEGRTPLFHAVLGARHTVLKALLGRGADLDVRDAHGSTPLQLAQARNMTYTVGILRQRQGASTETETAASLNEPLQLAQARNMMYTVGILRRHQGASTETETATSLNEPLRSQNFDRGPPAPSRSRNFDPFSPRSRFERETGLTDPMILRWD